MDCLYHRYFFYIDPENKNLVVDGQQRLLSVIYFFEGYFGKANEKGKRQVFKLTGLSKKSKYIDKRFEDLDLSDKRKLENSVLRAINIRQMSPKEENTSIYHIFERLNTGGTPLTAQEIRNVVFRGEFLNTLKELNHNKSWRAIINKKIEDKHQKDVELILRVFALSSHIEDYEKPMHEFMNKIAKQNIDGKSRYFAKFVQNFPIACELIEKSLRKKPFNVRGPLNTSVFDSVFSVIINNIKNIPADISARYESLLVDKTFIDLTSLGTTDTKTVKERFAFVKKTLID